MAKNSAAAVVKVAQHRGQLEEPVASTPPNWQLVPIASLCEAAFDGPFGSNLKSADYSESGVRVVRLENIGHLQFREDLRTFIPLDKYRDLEKHALFENDIVFSSFVDEQVRVCLIPASLGTAINKADCFCLRIDEAVALPQFVVYRLASHETYNHFKAMVRGVTRPRVNISHLKNYTIAVPPIAEQRRIVERLDRLIASVDTCRARLDRVPQILKKFREAVLEAAVSGRLTEEWRRTNEIAGKDEFHSFEGVEGDAFRGYQFPACWGRSRLSEIAEIAGGITKDSKKQELAGEELPYLRVANVQRGYLNLTEMKTIRVPRERVDSLLLRPGDMLFNEGGDLDKLGRGWVWEGQIERCVFQNHVFRARLGDNHFEPRFFSHFANSRGFDYFLARGKQTTNLASINKSVLSSLPVPVPSADEQVEIMRRINRLFGFADVLDRRYRDAVAGVEKLTPTVLAKAFRGELVPQDPNDEPAGTMLEGMARERKEIPMVAKKRTPARRNRKAGIREAPDVMVANATSTAPTDPEYENATGKLFSVLTNAGGWITAEQAFRECGIANGSNTREIESLYARLKEMDAAGELLIEAVRDKRGQKIGDRIRLK